MSNEAPPASRIESGHYVRFLLAAFVIIAALYLARVVFEPIAFALLGMALVWPFQQALEAKLPKPVALGLTILLALLVMLALAAAVVWSVDLVVHWTIANITLFQSLYAQWSQWLEGYGIFITEGMSQYNAGTFIG